MGTTIKQKRSSVAGKVPLTSDLDYGELAINYQDGVLYFKDAANVVRPIATTSSFFISGDFKFDTTTTASDPGGSRVRLNNATRSSVTNLYFDDLTVNDFDVSILFNTLGVGDLLILQDKDYAADAVRYTISGAPTDNTGWWTIPVTWVAESGSLWANNMILSAMILRIGGSAMPMDIVYSISTPTTAGAMAGASYYYFVSGSTTLTLPTAVGNTSTYIIKTTSGTSAIKTASTENIEGTDYSGTGLSLPALSAITLKSTGTEWFVL